MDLAPGGRVSETLGILRELLEDEGLEGFFLTGDGVCTFVALLIGYRGIRQLVEAKYQEMFMWSQINGTYYLSHGANAY